jgi:hypothetical protein
MNHHTGPNARRFGTFGMSALAATAVLAGTYAMTSGQASTAATRDDLRAASSASSSAGQVDQAKLKLQTSSPELAACFPHAKAHVTVDLTTDAIGKDRFTIAAKNLQPRTDFTVFLLEQSGAPFGAAEYIGDFTTDRWGKGHATFDLIVEEAFAFNNATGSRTDLNSVGFWFADEKADDKCLGKNSPVTGFDGDAAAGVQMMNSGNHFLP